MFEFNRFSHLGVRTSMKTFTGNSEPAKTTTHYPPKMKALQRERKCYPQIVPLHSLGPLGPLSPLPSTCAKPLEAQLHLAIRNSICYLLPMRPPFRLLRH
jgi:hypothetical protein